MDFTKNTGFGLTNIKGKLKPLHKGVLVKEMLFDEFKTASGLIIPGDDGAITGIHPRWAKVEAIGNEQEDVKVGDWILVAHGRWSRGFNLNDEVHRTVDPDDILGISEEMPNDLGIVTPTMGHQTRAPQMGD
jgi:co-chaperonin GroES (HSP10)